MLEICHGLQTYIRVNYAIVIFGFQKEKSIGQHVQVLGSSYCL